MVIFNLKHTQKSRGSNPHRYGLGTIIYVCAVDSGCSVPLLHFKVMFWSAVSRHGTFHNRVEWINLWEFYSARDS
jgi:hypothetical protein